MMIKMYVLAIAPLNTNNSCRIFMGPLILQMFGAHWTTVASMRKLDGIDDLDLPVGKPIAELGLAAAAVSIQICHRYMLMIHRSNRLSC